MEVMDRKESCPGRLGTPNLHADGITVEENLSLACSDPSACLPAVIYDSRMHSSLIRSCTTRSQTESTVISSNLTSDPLNMHRKGKKGGELTWRTNSESFCLGNTKLHTTRQAA